MQACKHAQPVRTQVLCLRISTESDLTDAAITGLRHQSQSSRLTCLTLNKLQNIHSDLLIILLIGQKIFEIYSVFPQIFIDCFCFLFIYFTHFSPKQHNNVHSRSINNQIFTQTINFCQAPLFLRFPNFPVELCLQTFSFQPQVKYISQK